MYDYLKNLFLYYFRIGQKEVLETVDDILSEFDERVERLKAANARAIAEAQSFEDMANHLLDEADGLRETAARGESAAKKLAALVG